VLPQDLGGLQLAQRFPGDCGHADRGAVCD
jgi:hypothetical protein